METLKKYYTIGCCGIDCGLCPRFHTKGGSVCPGCGGLNFKEKHPACGFVTCCVIKNGLEVCSDCKDYPCYRFDSERKGYDSFVTHKKVFPNLEYIKNNGIKSFIEQQNERRDILIDFISKYDDGRSKSFFCISCALLPLNKLQETHRFIDRLTDSSVIKEKNKRLKDKLQMIAENLKIDLKLNNKK
ncbi:DUF3795 domain-containing protein [bacterium]|nr:DUF3795 domain-containing protein [bacterium]